MDVQVGEHDQPGAAYARLDLPGIHSKALLRDPREPLDVRAKILGRTSRAR